MKALILAAGLGTRLYPLTADTPKALVQVNGMTMLERAIRKLASAGFNEIVVNVHHHAEKIKDFLRDLDLPGITTAISDESDLLLDTGGAILKARPFLDDRDPFLVHNVDVISNIDLQALLTDHLECGNMATLSVIDRPTKRYFLFDSEMGLRGWTDTSTGEIRWTGRPAVNVSRLAFSGIHIISPAFFKVLRQSGRFSIIQTYLDMAVQHPIRGHTQEGAVWFDLGKPEQLTMASEYIKNHPELNIYP